MKLDIHGQVAICHFRDKSKWKCELVSKAHVNCSYFKENQMILHLVKKLNYVIVLNYNGECN